MKCKEPVDDMIGAFGAFVTGMFMTGVLAVPAGVFAIIVLMVAYAALLPITYGHANAILLVSFGALHLWLHLNFARKFGSTCRSRGMTYALGFGAMTTWLLLALAQYGAGSQVEAIIPIVYSAIIGALCQYVSGVGMRTPSWSIGNICPTCGYSLENLPEPGCPECGYDRAPSTPPHNSP